jgi:hypothetical protein
MPETRPVYLPLAVAPGPDFFRFLRAVCFFTYRGGIHPISHWAELLSPGESALRPRKSLSTKSSTSELPSAGHPKRNDIVPQSHPGYVFDSTAEPDFLPADWEAIELASLRDRQMPCSKNFRKDEISA